MDTFPQKLKKFFIKVGKVLLDILCRIGNVFKTIGLGIWHGILGLGRAFKKFGLRFVDASIWTKISHVIMGFGNFARKQFVKGFIFLAIEAAFITFMVISPTTSEGVHLGAKAIPNFFSLGDCIGMQVNDLSFIETNFYVVNGSRDKAEIFLDLNDENNSGARQKLSRVHNLVEYMKSGKESENFRIADNDGTIYSSRNYSKVIYDSRNKTNDIYAMNEYVGASESFIFEGTDVVVLESNKLLFGAEDEYGKNFLPDVPIDDITAEEAPLGKFSYTAQYRTEQINKQYMAQFITFYRGSETVEIKDVPTYVVYLDESSIGSEYYTYYFVLFGSSGSARKKNNFKLNDDYLATLGADLEIKAFNFSYNQEHVVSKVDYSFLMLLYGLITFAIIAVFVALWLLNIASSYKADIDVREGRKPSTFIEDVKALFDSRFHVTMLAPAIVMLLVFTIVPTILMILIAFTDMTGSSSTAGLKLINFVGFQNFVDLFNASGESEIAREVGRNFLSVFTWTIEWAIIATFSCYFGGILLALLINKKGIKYKKLWRTVFILTIAIPQFITLLIIRNLLKPSGPLNTMFGTAIDFLGQGAKSSTMNPWIPKITVLVVNLYIGIPYTMLMTSGILMNIPADLYEAATIDGANRWQMFRKITLPYIVFVTTPYLISSFIGNITSFNTIFLLTGGGPAYPITPGSTSSIAGQTDLLVTWLYKLTITNYRYNAGSIIGILTFIITAFITLVCYRNSKAYKEEDTFQ